MSIVQRHRPSGWSIAAAIALLGLVVVSLPGVSDDPVLRSVIWALGGALPGARLAQRARTLRSLPAALLATGALVWSAGSLWYGLAVDGGAYGSFADVLWVASYAFFVAGALALAHRARAGRDLDVALDATIAALAAAALAAAVMLPLVDSAGTDLSTALLAWVYPVADTALVAIVVAGAVAAGGRAAATWRWLGAGFVLMMCGDALFAVDVASSGAWALGGYVDLVWPVAYWLLSCAPPLRADAQPLRTTVHRVPVVPLCGAAIAVCVLIADVPFDVFEVAELLAIGALIAAILRTALALRANVRLQDSADQAMRDELTGLANRRALLRDLDLVYAAAPGPATLVLFDLDGFKAYNDAYGHAAGDALLTSLGQRLQRAVDGHGRAYRQGGDEFCVLIGAQGVDHRLVLDRAIDALRQEGDGFSIGASFGDVVVPRDAATAAAALQLADARMYARKDAGRASTRRQSRDLLLQLLHEQQPDLEEHSGDVGELVVAVGRRLGLSDEQLDHARHAAELHDVGKVAIPAAILRKPGPLDDDEWVLMRRHTIIGERILSAVPALIPVGRIVRSTHERWDGGGYPDGLRGEEIPLAARIISVCDTFHAITTDRPYRAGRSADEALAELRRCAGTQFDPDVVEAFAVELDRGFADGAEGAACELQNHDQVARRVLPAGAIAQNAAGELAQLAKLRGLLRATQLASGGADVAEVLDAIAQTIASSLGFRVVSVNLFRPEWDDFVCTAVHGDEAVRGTLLGKIEPAESWRPVLDERFERCGAYFVPAGAIDYGDDEGIWHVPDIAPTDDPGAWQADDFLVVPLRSGRGDVLGLVSVDEPVWGRRPSDAEIEVLVAVAEHAATAVQRARSAATARRARNAEERVALLGAELSTTTSGREAAAVLERCAREALAFGTVAVDVVAEPATAQAVEALLDGAEEVDGVVLLAGEQAAAARAWRGLAAATRNGRGARAWDDHLIVAPIRGAEGELLGVLWADDPVDRLLPHRSTRRVLRTIAAQAVVPLAWGRRAPAPMRNVA